MVRYTDELDAVIAHEEALRLRIAERLAEEAGLPFSTHVEQFTAVASDAIETWRQQGEEEADLRAFRELGPLQQLLTDHRQTLDRIADMLDRRLA